MLAQEYGLLEEYLDREIDELADYYQREYPPERERTAIHSLSTMMIYARDVCREVIKMVQARERNQRRSEIMHFMEACEHARWFFQEGGRHGMHRLNQYDPLVLIIEDFSFCEGQEPRRLM